MTISRTVVAIIFVAALAAGLAGSTTAVTAAPPGVTITADDDVTHDW
jgi:hypothetical protein